MTSTWPCTGTPLARTSSRTRTAAPTDAAVPRLARLPAVVVPLPVAVVGELAPEEDAVEIRPRRQRAGKVVVRRLRVTDPHTRRRRIAGVADDGVCDGQT